jgi:hypothetical protein
MEKLIAYAAQFEPDFPRRIRGSSRADIAALAGLVGQPLPPEYESFLGYLGESDGGLKLAFDGSTALPDIMDFYREYVQTGDVTLPPGCLAIGADGMTGEAICLQTSGLEVSGGALPPPGTIAGKARVVFTGEGQVRGGYAASLEGLLYRTVYMKFRYPLMKHQKLFLGNLGGFAAAQATAQRLGFKPEPFSDSFVYCGERPGELLILIQYEGQPLTLHFACADAAAFDQVDSLVHQEFGLKENALQES